MGPSISLLKAGEISFQCILFSYFLNNYKFLFYEKKKSSEFSIFYFNDTYIWFHDYYKVYTYRYTYHGHAQLIFNLIQIKYYKILKPEYILMEIS